jgi:hypothetical protein
MKAVAVTAVCRPQQSERGRSSTDAPAPPPGCAEPYFTSAITHSMSLKVTALGLLAEVDVMTVRTSGSAVAEAYVRPDWRTRSKCVWESSCQ